MAVAFPDAAVSPRSFLNDSYRNGFLGTVDDFQKAGVLQDVVLEVEGRRFPCHRLVLSAASPYFRAMFTSDMAESRQKTVVLQGLNADMLEEILSYIYSGTLLVSLDKVQPLYQAADLLQVDYVRETCTSYMAMNVEHSTCLDLYKFADAFSVKKVLKCCLQYIHWNFAEVSTTAEFCSLSVDQLTDIINHDGMNVEEETTVWEAVVRWMEHRREERQHLLPSILPHIRFNLMTSEETAAMLEHPLVREDPGSSQVIRNVVPSVTSKKKRVGMDTEEMALLFNESTKELFCMNPRVGKYMCCRVTGLFNAGFAATTTSDDIYILDRRSYTQLFLLSYDHVESMWVQESVCTHKWLEEYDCDDLPTSRLLAVDGHLYHLAIKESKVVEIQKYIRHTRKWQDCSVQQLKRIGYVGVVVSCGPHLYFLSNRKMHRYDPSQDKCCQLTAPNSTLTNMPYTAVAMGTEIFCTDEKFSDLLVYSTVSDSWQRIQVLGQPTPVCRGYMDRPRLFVLENRLHILLQSKNSSYSSSPAQPWQVCVYDRCADTWSCVKITLPSQGWWTAYGPACPVARMYLPYLETNGTDVETDHE